MRERNPRPHPAKAATEIGVYADPRLAAPSDLGRWVEAV